MKQIKLTFLLTMLMSMVSIGTMAHDFEVANADGITIFYVKTSDTEVAVSFQGTSYSSYSEEYSGSVVIPSSVTYNGNDYSVTSINHDTFNRCFNLTSVTIPNSITSIGYQAFYSCRSLTSISIPSSITFISSDAFAGCSGLTSIQVADGNTMYFPRKS